MTEQFSGYDIIGDVHGCGKSLERLLLKLGYSKRDGCYEYNDGSKPRQLIFLGDILDRGPHIREAMLLVREMVERGSAQMIMGNHEYNALTYTTPAPVGSGRQYVREHTERHSAVIAETLQQFANHPDDWKALLSWFYQLPILLEFSHFRVVHACWDQTLIDQFQQQCPDNRIDRDFLLATVDHHSFESRFLSRVTQGVELLLPDQMVIAGSHGYNRRRFRAKFWLAAPQTYGEVEFQPDRLPEYIAEQPLTDVEREYLPYYGPERQPLFVGHYRQKGIPQPLTDNVACLDYSAVNEGRLVAYRMDGESKLDAEKFVWVDYAKN